MNPLLWRHTVGLFFVVGLSACAVSARAPATDGLAAVETDHYRVPAKLDDGWDTGAADVAGMDAGRLVAMTSTIRRYSDWNIHAVLVERGGRLVYEEYFPGSDERVRPLQSARWEAHVRLVEGDRKVEGASASGILPHGRTRYPTVRRVLASKASVFGPIAAWHRSCLLRERPTDF